MQNKIAWGILGAGRIAAAFAKGLKASKTGTLLSVGSRDQAKAEVFGVEHGAIRRYGNYQAMLDDKDVQAVYVATPHPMHMEWTIKALEAGKHVLCEKPIGINHAQAAAMFDAAKKAQRILMEAFMYRCHPQIAQVLKFVRDKAIGECRVIEACFSFSVPFDSESRLFKNDLGGGGILDVGCYPVSMARLVAGAAVGKDFAEPVEIKGVGVLGKTGVDEMASAVMKFPGGILAEVSTGVIVKRDAVVRIHGSEGEIIISEPWVPQKEGGQVKIILKNKTNNETREIFIDAPPLYAIEADTFVAGIEKGRIESPAMTPEDSLGNMKALDRWRESIGLVYESEEKAE